MEYQQQKYNPMLIPRERITAKVLTALPKHDMMWDLCMAPNDTLYIGAYCEHTGGMSAWLCSDHHRTDRIEYLADLVEVTGEPNDLGMAYGCHEDPDQLEVPYPGGMTFGKDGYLYYTIQEGRPEARPPWRGHLIRYDTAQEKAEDLGIVVPDGVAFSGCSCHGKTDSLGNIYFAQNSSVPPQFFIYHVGRK